MRKNPLLFLLALWSINLVAMNPLENLIKEVQELLDQPHLQLYTLEYTLNANIPKLLEKYYLNMLSEKDAQHLTALKTKLLNLITEIANNNTDTWGEVLNKALELDNNVVEHRSNYDQEMFCTVFEQNSYAQYNPNEIATAYSIRELVDHIKNILTIIPAPLNKYPMPKAQEKTSSEISVIEQEYNRLLQETNERHPLDEQLVKYSKNKSSLDISLLKKLIADASGYDLDGFIELKKEVVQKIINDIRSSGIDNRYLQHIDTLNRTARNTFQCNRTINRLRSFLLRGKCAIKNSDLST